MADISKFKSPDNTEYTLKDSVSRFRMDVQTGTGTAGQAGSSSVAYIPSLWKFNLGFTPAAGDIITIKIPVAGVNAGCWISVDNGAHYYPVALYSNVMFTTHYGVNENLTLIYQTGMSTKIYGTDETGAAAGSSTAAQTIDRWAILNGRDTNTTYSEISTTNLRGSDKTTTGLITGRRFYDAITYNLKVTSGDVQLYGTHLTGQVPAVTSSDNGKFLTVQNGAWTATTMATWQGGSY